MYKNLITKLVVGIFCFQTVSAGYAENAAISAFAPGLIIPSGSVYHPMVLKGLIIRPENPLELGFVMDAGDSDLSSDEVQAYTQRLVNYFTAALTVPSGDFWVNLSPFEKDRVIPDGLGRTELGRDLLEQDYILKQLTASLMNPDSETGKKFWEKVYENIYNAGLTDKESLQNAAETFNKVWIMPESARVYEQGSSVFVINGRMKVMLESDYLALSQDGHTTRGGEPAVSSQIKDIIRAIVIPEIEREVNEGEHFAPLRQIYYSLILAKWYKNKIRDSVLDKIYINQNKIEGVDLKDTQYQKDIYQQYVQAYRGGAFDIIREDYDPSSQEMVVRKYFSGGIQDGPILEDSGSLDELERSFHGSRNDFDLTLMPRIPETGEGDPAMQSYTGMTLNEFRTKLTRYQVERFNREDDGEFFKAYDNLKNDYFPKGDVEFILVKTGNEPFFGAIKEGDFVYIDEAYFKEMHKKQAVHWQQRLLINVFTPGGRLEKLKAEYVYARDLHLTDNILYEEGKTFDEVIAYFRSEMLVLFDHPADKFDKEKFKKIFLEGYSFEVYEPLPETIMKSYHLWLKAEESLYRIAINHLNKRVNLKARVRLSESEEMMTSNDDVNVAMEPFAADPITDAHLMVLGLGSLAEGEADTMLLKVAKKDFRKPYQEATFEIRNALAKEIASHTGGLFRVLTLPEEIDSIKWGINGEEAVDPLLQLNHGARTRRVVYAAGGDHNLTFYRNKLTNQTDFTKIDKDNDKDFRYYVQLPHYKALIQMLLDVETVDGYSPIPSQHQDFIRRLLESDNPEEFLVEGVYFPKLDVIGKLWLVQKKNNDPSVTVDFVYTERAGDNLIRDTLREHMLEQGLFRTIFSQGVEADISSSNHRLAAKIIVERDVFDLNYFYSMPATVLKFLLKKEKMSRKYFLSFLRQRAPGKPAERFSKALERLFPLQVQENVAEMRNFEIVLAQELNETFDIPEEKLLTISQKGESGKTVIALQIHSNNEYTVVDFSYQVETELGNDIEGINKITGISFEFDDETLQFLEILDRKKDIENILLHHAMELNNETKTASEALLDNAAMLKTDGMDETIEFDLAMMVNVEERSLFGNVIPGIESANYSDGNLVSVVDGAIGNFIGYKDRSRVHRDGDFHNGVQAYVLRENESGKVEVLVQKRSNIVDISKGKYDQSLATQVLAKDGGNLDVALKRGLMEELGINSEEIEYTRVGYPAWLRVHKKYEEDSALYNREFISLYFVKIHRADVTSVNPKVASLEWIEWDEFVHHLKSRPQDFTKTARFYVMDPVVLEETQKALQAFMNGERPATIFPLNRGCYYSYPGRYDIFISVLNDGRAKIHIYDYENTQMTEVEDVLSFDPYEAKDRRSVAIRITKTSGENFIWEDGQLTPTGLHADQNSLRFMETIISGFSAEMDGLADKVRGEENRRILVATWLKFNRNFKILMSRILAGEVVLLPSLPNGEEGSEFQMENMPNEMTIVALPGTFDPPHFSHIDLLLDALVHESEKARGQRRAYAAFLNPVGENAPGPDGQPWKGEKTASQKRHEMSERMSAIFYPLIQTSRAALQYSSEYGTENAIRILDLIPASKESKRVKFVIAAGSDTYLRWKDNMKEIIERAKERYKNTDLEILILQGQKEPIQEDMKTNLPPFVGVFSDRYSIPLYSTDFRKGLYSLSPLAVRDYIGENHLYDTAMLHQSTEEEFGGIDLNTIELQGEGSGIIKFDPAILEPLKQSGLSGFIPVISNFRSVEDMSELLGN